jgi:hypothetical protein
MINAGGKGYTVKTVKYERLFSIGAYENIRIGLEASVDPGQDPADVVRALANQVVEMVSPGSSENPVPLSGSGSVDVF